MVDVSGKRVTVMGLGRFGGGVGVTKWLAANGAEVLVTDIEAEADLTESVAKIQNLIDRGRVSLRLGGHNVSDFTTCDVVVANPAVPKPWDNRFLRAAEAAGKPVVTEMSLLLERLPHELRERTVGVTGSVGKSTTSAMIHHALATVARARAGKALLGGNIGGSLLGELEAFDERTWLVLEISSAMLYWLDRAWAAKWSPRVSVLTNLSPNHIDWHGDMEHYTRSKLALFAGQGADDWAVLGPGMDAHAKGLRGRVVHVDPVSFKGSLKLPGAHNRVNAATALAACRALVPDASEETIVEALREFPGLAHRLQLVCERRTSAGGDPVRFYNDSKSTTPESALKAIEAVAGMPGMSRARIHLIAGGYDKGSDLSPIAAAASDLGGLYTIGATGPVLVRAANGRPRVKDCTTLDAAVRDACESMRPGEVLLLSPGCASWDQFTNFEERGERFSRLVQEARL